MTKARYLPERDYFALKAASRDLVVKAGKAKRVCELTRGSPARLSEALAPQCDDRFLAIDQVADMEADVGEPIVTRMLADMLGCDVNSRETKAPHETLCTLLAAVNRKSAEVGSKFLEADEDHRITEEERQRVRRAIEEAIDAMRQALVAITVEPTLRAVG